MLLTALKVVVCAVVELEFVPCTAPPPVVVSAGDVAFRIAALAAS
jgi:hypothetical protein